MPPWNSRIDVNRGAVTGLMALSYLFPHLGYASVQTTEIYLVYPTDRKAGPE